VPYNIFETANKKLKLFLNFTSLQVYSQYSWTLCPYVYTITYMYNK